MTQLQIRPMALADVATMHQGNGSFVSSAAEHDVSGANALARASVQPGLFDVEPVLSPRPRLKVIRGGQLAVARVRQAGIVVPDRTVAPGAIQQRAKSQVSMSPVLKSPASKPQESKLWVPGDHAAEPSLVRLDLNRMRTPAGASSVPVGDVAVHMVHVRRIELADPGMDERLPEASVRDSGASAPAARDARVGESGWRLTRRGVGVVLTGFVISMCIALGAIGHSLVVTAQQDAAQAGQVAAAEQFVG